MDIQYLKRDGKPDIAYRKTVAADEADAPIVVFCGGFRSDMEGTKAVFLEELCKAEGYGYIRFDYSGHGQSGGIFEEGTISQWKDDALSVIDTLTGGKIVLVGSLMGGWISFLIARERPDIVHGLIGLAAAPDFSREMYSENFSEDMRVELQETGRTYLPNDYSDEPYIITRDLIEDGEKNCFLDKGMALSCPVSLIQGKKDRDVPWKVAQRIQEVISGTDVKVTYLDNADHRLSAPDELAVLKEELTAMLDKN